MPAADTDNESDREIDMALAEAARREALRGHHRSEDTRHPSSSFHLLDSFELRSDMMGKATSTRVIVIERTHGRLNAGELERQFGLTSREAEVAQALGERLSSAEIARALGISLHTARRHAERVLVKLGVQSRRDVGVLLQGRRRVASHNGSQ